jgi:bifunctional DNA-binding transcriptional regulator/antitoxin component of YhaV-PrlF toxin-antitoxin module
MEFRTKLEKDGKIVLPEEIIKNFSLSEGDELVIRLYEVGFINSYTCVCTIEFISPKGEVANSL